MRAEMDASLLASLTQEWEQATLAERMDMLLGRLKPTLRCPVCGSVAWELRDGQDRRSIGRCTEATCKHEWTW